MTFWHPFLSVYLIAVSSFLAFFVKDVVATAKGEVQRIVILDRRIKKSRFSSNSQTEHGARR